MIWDVLYQVFVALLAAGATTFGLASVAPVAQSQTEQDGRNLTTGLAALCAAALAVALA